MSLDQATAEEVEADIEVDKPVHTWEASDDKQALRVLVGEDSQVNMMVIEKLLSGPDFELFMAEDGEEAVQLFKKMEAQGQRPDIILLDIEMPAMTGHEATVEIRKLEQEKNLPMHPIIAVTALSDHTDVAASREAGMNDHLVKPIKKDILLTSIAKVLAFTARK